MKTALLSVYHKAGIVEFGQGLVDQGWQLMASGGTAKALQAAGLSVTDVAKFVGEPILGHRVVTLSREIHAALLAMDKDNEELERLGIPHIGLVCVDLYPLAEVIMSGKPHEEVIEMTDIGGPTLLRSAAKGGRIVISTPGMREKTLEWIAQGEPDGPAFRRHLAGMAELVVSQYSYVSGSYLAPDLVAGPFPKLNF